MNFRTYFDVAGEDRSKLADQVAAQRRRVAERLAAVQRVVAVMSGKGGVGKSYVCALAARYAALHTGTGVGVLDADLRSPTVARLLGAKGPLRVTEGGVQPAVGTGGVRIVSTDLLLKEGEPLRWREPDAERFVWRGVLESGTLREFLGDVIWGDLDVLFVDLPPGADGVADLNALVPGRIGAIIVTVPTDESRRSVERTMRAARDDGIGLLGVVENMSGYICAECRHPGPLFEGTAGRDLAEAFDVPLLATIPLMPEVPSDPDLRDYADPILTAVRGIGP